MGFLDFVSSVGENLFGGAVESVQERSAKLQNHVRKLGLEVAVFCLAHRTPESLHQPLHDTQFSVRSTAFFQPA